MPPKRKRLGRPPGSKNKKTKQNVVESNAVKDECSIRKVEYICCVCSRAIDVANRGHEKRCKNRKSQTINEVIRAKKSAFSCTECPKKFRFRNSFTEHLRNEHSKLRNSMSCDQCSVKCPDKVTLGEHIKKVHDRQIFSCSYCNKEFVRRSHVLRHLAQRGCDGKGVSRYPCEICDAKFTRKDNLIVHLRLQHILKNAFKCKQCSYHTRSFPRLINHWHQLHSDTPNYYQCDHCGKATSSRAAMAKHLEIHGEKKFSCDVCGYSTFTIEVMRRHVLTHVENKPFKCSLCGQSYIQRIQLERHLVKHTGYLCIECGDTFSSKLKLIIHQRQHMGLQKLICPIEDCPHANKEFSCEASLNNHIKTHLDEKKWRCEVCAKGFHSEVNMRRHLATHALDRPRRCMYCVQARAYVRGEQLVRHVRKHHCNVFRTHLTHVRQVLQGASAVGQERVKKSELESILNVLDAEAERILQGYGGSGVLYGGMQEDAAADPPPKTEANPLLSEEELRENLNKLLSQMIDKDMLECFGWPEETVDVVLEKVIEHCGAKPADRDKWSTVQRLRENTKHLFLYVIEDKNIARMLDTHTIDQIVKHILTQVTDDDAQTADKTVIEQ